MIRCLKGDVLFKILLSYLSTTSFNCSPRPRPTLDTVDRWEKKKNGAGMAKTLDRAV